MDIPNIISVAGVVFLAGMIQSAVGLGYGLIVVPLFILLGMSLPAAMTAMYVCSFVQSVSGAVHLRAHIPWKLSLTTIAAVTAVTAFSLSFLKKISFLDPGYVKMIVGAILCLMSIVQLLFMSRPLKTENRLWAVPAFVISGLVMGICGMGGPPLIVWTMTRDWSVKKTRGFLFSVYSGIMPTQLVLLYVTFGYDIVRIALDALPLIPAVLAGVAVGLPLGNLTPEKIFGRIVNLILLSTGAGMIIQKFL